MTAGQQDERLRVAVLDDEPDSPVVKAVVEELSRSFNVVVPEIRPSTTEQHLAAVCVEFAPSAIVVDYRLRPPTKRLTRKRDKEQPARPLTGLGVAQRVAAHIPCYVEFITRYPAMHDLDNEFDPLTPHGQTEKPDTTSRSAQDVARRVRDKIERGMAEIDISPRPIAELGLDLDPAPLDELPLGESLKVLLRLREAVGNRVDHYFDDDKLDWLVIAGNELRILRVGSGEPPPHDELQLLAKSTRQVPVVVTRAGQLRQFDCRRSADDGEAPRLRVEAENEAFDLPVDTGASRSMMSEPYALGRGLIEGPAGMYGYPPYSFRTATGEVVHIQARLKEFDAYFYKCGGGQIRGKWPLLLAPRYVELGLGKSCQSGCTAGVSATNGSQCPTWLGFVGYDVAEVNSFGILVNGSGKPACVTMT